MTIDDLIAELEEAREAKGGHAEVRIAYQQSYPLRGDIARVTVPDTEGESAPGQDADGQMVWIAVGAAPYSENPYGPEWAWTGEFPEPDGCPACGAPEGEEHGCTLAERSCIS